MLVQYQTRAVIFPSEIETFGLPLIEARSTNTPVLAIDLPYAREVLNGYANVKYFESVDAASTLIQDLHDRKLVLNDVTKKIETHRYPTIIEWMIMNKGDFHD
jgi:glycosyltransferase involved in cell wall biosynthesis